MNKSIKHSLPHRWVKQTVTVEVTIYPFADMKAVKGQAVFVELKGLGRNRIQGIGSITEVGELTDVKSDQPSGEIVSTYFIANGNVKSSVTPEHLSEELTVEAVEEGDVLNDEDSDEE